MTPGAVRRKLARQPFVPVGKLADDMHAATRGIVEPLDGVRLTSPLGGTPCVLWRAVVEEVGTGGDYVELGRREDAIAFLLRTPDGSARVVPARPHLGLEPANVVVRPCGAYADAFGALVAQVKKPNYPTSSMLRVKELVIVPGMQLRVSGYIAREQDPDAAENVAGYRGDLPTRPVLSGTRRVPLLLGE